MSTWNEGYTTDVQYTSFFHTEIAPVHIAFAAATAGYRAPDLSQPFAYCELGSGQGVTLNGIAALHPESEFWGFDFNPAQISNAQRMADIAELKNVNFRDWSFADALDHSEELPRFDVIALHGILSWVSDENRAEIVRFINRTLRPGGLVYASYNCQPGWAQSAPFRHLARQHYLRHPGRSDLHVPKVLAFTDQLTQIGAAYFQANPGVNTRLQTMRNQPPAYFAHEFLNSNWRPFYFNEIAEEMAAARLDYLASATLIENVPVASLPPGVPALLEQHMPNDRVWQELAKDFANNKMFRRDIYVRGLNALNAREQNEALRQQKFVLVVARDDVKLVFQGPIGNVNGAPDVYNPIIDRLAKGAASFDDVVAVIPDRDRSKALQALTLLLHSRQIQPARSATGAKQTQALNRYIVDRHFDGNSFGIVLAPGAGTALPASGHELSLLGAVLDGNAKTVEEAANYIVARLASMGRAPQKDGVALQGPDAVAHIVEQQRPLYEKRLPIWKALGVY